MLNTIVSVPPAAFAARISWRSDPAPESFVLVTVKVASAWSQAACVLAQMDRLERFVAAGQRNFAHLTNRLRSVEDFLA
jgi:hypothetical protein